MKTREELDLLIDVAKLLKKYGPAVFESLAKLISTPEINNQLARILLQGARTARSTVETRGKVESERKPIVPRALASLKTVDPEKYLLIEKFYNDLVEKSVLPSLRDIREFAVQSGLPEIRSSSRQRAVTTLVGALIKSPNEQLIERIKLLEKYDAADRSLQGWSNIILDRDRKQPRDSE